jgi:hypothetical protein
VTHVTDVAGAAAIVATLDGDALVLLARTSQPLSGREVASRLGLHSHAACASRSNDWSAKES